jgi:hypothetical protein
MSGTGLARNGVANGGRTSNTNLANSGRSSILNNSSQLNTLTANGGYGYGNGGYGYGNGGYGYRGWGNGNGNSGYVWVFIPSLGWVMIPIRVLLMLGL